MTGRFDSRSSCRRARGPRDNGPQNPYQSNFELDEEGYRNLLQEFKRVYHDDYKDFEEIWNSLDDEIKQDLSIVNNPKQVKA